MEGLAAVALVAALTFGVCFGLDKCFTKIFRSQTRHRTGFSVRMSKKYGAIGAVLLAAGIGAMLAGKPLMLAAGALVALVGVGLAVYYMSFGIFYDDRGFLLTSFGRKSVNYEYRQIRAQQLYIVGGSVMIELYLQDDRTVQLNTSMEGVYPFLDKAFVGWCAQRGIAPESCAFHDPEKSCWFPLAEG